MATKQYADYTSVNYTYDAAGRLTQVADPTGTYTFGFDNMGRLTSATTNYKFTTFGNKTVQYGYDAASNRTAMTDPQNASTTYGYDVLNRLGSLGFNGQSFGFAYDALSRRTSLTRLNGVNTTYSYDPASRLLSVLHQLGTTTLDGAAYTYDNAGNRLSRTDQRTGTSLSYGYDNIYQLLSVMQGSTTTESYTYDIVGNRLSSLGVSPYTYNSSNELMSLPSGSYTYDKNGNTTVKPDGTQYTWDYENRLTQVVLPSSGGTANFKYDPFGRRIQKAFTQGSTTTTTNYLYDGRDLLEELDNNGNALARYTDGPGFDQPLSMLRSGTTSYYQSDVLSTITSLSNAAGALANTYTYDSYGKLTTSTGNITNPLQYTGREFDPETGIYYYRARYYDQSVGRFISEDPIRFQGGSDFYDYTLNSPVNWIDPFGLEVQECRRPLNLPLSNHLPPHTFLYSTQSGTGFGLGPKNDAWGAWAAESGGTVPGNIEKDYPYDPSGKLKPQYSCSKYSDDKCIEDCINQKSINATQNPPSYQLGVYQCDTWANDIERQCTQQCNRR